MAVHCRNCGAELFAGQQFCRRCGTPTGELAGEQPTQLFGGQAPPGGASTGEVAGGPPTNSVAPRTTAHYVPPQVPSPPPPGAPTTVFAPPPRRKSRRWLYAFTIIGVMGAVMLVSLLAAIATRRNDDVRANVKERVRREIRINRPEQPAAPAPPPEPGAQPIDEAGAQVSDDETVIKRTFDLGKEATVTLKNVNGPVSVEGWDEPRAEVTITKRGGTQEMRRGVRVAFVREGERLSLQTLMGQGGPFEVAYEVKLPRKLAKLEINSVKSDVELSDIAGAISVDVKQGDIEMSGVSGPVRTNLVNGDTEVELKGGGAPGPCVFKTVNGGFELRLPEGVNADLEAEVTNGGIDADEGLKLEVESRPGSKKARGRVGQGGTPVSVRVVNGTIRLRD